jgi:GNAT superfamily N-acetyltransferase
VNPAVLAVAEDANALMPLAPGEERIVRDEWVLWLGRDARWSCVQRIRLGDVEAAVDEVRALLRERGRTLCEWEFGPSATPADLEQRLVALGCTPNEEPVQTIMVLTHEPPPSELDARPVASAAELAEADRVMAAAFGGDVRGDAEGRWRDRDPAVRETFVALLDGHIVGAATATYADVAVQLNAGAVLPEARGRGAYRALVVARWRAARERGLEAAVTQAGAMSYDILLRLGFEPHGTIRSYVDTAER